MRRRITPAYAGNTILIIYSPLFRQDHPRLRGEHTKKHLALICQLGSPPPTRGTLHTFQIYLADSGITPAYAGNTFCLFFDVFCIQDHPRLRGEHVVSFMCHRLFAGSPPPTRGTLVSVGITTPFTRITPAYAGNTHFCLFSSTAHWDHGAVGKY